MWTVQFKLFEVKSYKMQMLVKYVCVFVLICTFPMSCTKSNSSDPDPVIFLSSKDDPALALVKEFNSDPSGGSTVRWEQTTVFVYDPVGIPNLQGILNDWNNSLAGKLSLVKGEKGSLIEFSQDNTLPECGVAELVFRGQLIRSVRIVMRCISSSIVAKQELGHAIGFFGHTADGGVMDTGARSERISSDVNLMLRKLYDLSAGTAIS